MLIDNHYLVYSCMALKSGEVIASLSHGGRHRGEGGKEGSSPLTFYLGGGQSPPTLLQYMHVIHYYSIDIILTSWV